MFTLMIFPEPIGSSHPKVTNHDLRRVVSHQGQTLALNCEGQAFPVPAYRCVAKKLYYVYDTGLMVSKL